MANGRAHSWLPYTNGEVYITGYSAGSGNGDIHFRNDNGSSYTERMIIEGTTGNVGIGTASPEQPLNVNGHVQVGMKTGGTYNGVISLTKSDRYPAIGFLSGTTPKINLVTDVLNGDLYIDVARKFVIRDNALGTGATTFFLNPAGDAYFLNAGNLGIGTASPAGKLHINSGDLIIQSSAGTGSDATLKFRDDDSETDQWRIAIDESQSNKLYFYDDVYNQVRMVIQQQDGNVGIGTTSPSEKLDVAGTVKMEVLKITGGSDLAEPFEVTGETTVQPGIVVSIDPSQPGQLTVSTAAYDRKVAGIISGANGVNPGILMTADESNLDLEHRHPVALTGRVYAWADASNGPIKPGDLLTTSDTPGHAMKVSDYTQAQGAIIGKAMSALEEGQGLVLVLVSLQ